MVGIRQGGGAAHDVALHVAAGGDGGEQLLVDGGDGRLEIALQHAVKLKALPGGDPERPIGVVVGDLFQRQVLVGGDRACRNGHPHHEGVRLLLSGRLPPPALIAGVLLIGAVELEQMDVVGAEVGGVRRERLCDGAAQVAALCAWRSRLWIRAVPVIV